MKLRKIESRLENRFGKKIWEPRGPAVDVLISTILSQNTSDANSARAFSSLKTVFKSWEAVGKASPGRIEKSIRVGGLARIKAGYIKEALRRIRRDFGKYDLSDLKKMSLEDSLEYLTALPGVGEKPPLVCYCLHLAARSCRSIHMYIASVYAWDWFPKAGIAAKLFNFGLAKTI